MAVAIELQAEWQPGGHPQIDQSECGIDEVEVVVQAFAAVRPHQGPAGRLIMPRSIAVAGFHRRDDVHQPGPGAALREHLGDNVLLRMWLLVMCSMVTPASAASATAHSRTRSRSFIANGGSSKMRIALAYR